jgi:hypothetical protein
MTGLAWRAVATVSNLLESHERDAVCGDLVECGEGAWRSLVDVLGLVIRRQSQLWKSWRPWVAGFGLVVPSSFLLMGLSVSVSGTYLHLTRHLQPSGLTDASLIQLILSFALLLGWSWTGGFVVGSISRRTLWLSSILYCFPCLRCLREFHIPSMSKFCLLLFLAPTILGIERGLRIGRIGLNAALVFAIAITILALPLWSNPAGGNWRHPSPWILSCVLSWPAWYLVAVAGNRTRDALIAQQENS